MPWEPKTDGNIPIMGGCGLMGLGVKAMAIPV